MSNNRNWHAGKPKKTPDYNPESIKQELLDAAVSIYGEGDEHPSLRKVAEELEVMGYGSLNPAKVKKLLITGHAYSTPITEKIQQLRADGRTVVQIMSLTGLSRAAVNNNLPYEKIVYNLDQSGGAVSVNADRVRLYKKRKKACEKLQKQPNVENLWACVVAFENYPLKTVSGLEFTYSFKLNRRGEKGNEIVVSRKEKTITRSSVEKAFAVVIAAGELSVRMSTPKELGVFGASYIYPLFVRLGLVEHVESGGERKK